MFLGMLNSSKLFLKIGEAWKLSTTENFEDFMASIDELLWGICKKLFLMSWASYDLIL